MIVINNKFGLSKYKDFYQIEIKKIIKNSSCHLYSLEPNEQEYD